MERVLTPNEKLEKLKDLKAADCSSCGANPIGL